MAAKTMSISVTPELKAAIQSRVQSGLYGNASDVIRAGLRALSREEIAASIGRQFEEIVSQLPQDAITPRIEQEIEHDIRRARTVERRKRLARK